MRKHILPVLGSPNSEIGRYICLVIGAMAACDLPRSEWVELIPTLSQVVLDTEKY